MSTRVPALALCGLLAGCGPAAAPPPVDQPDQPVAAAAATATAAGTPAATKVVADGKAPSPDSIGPRPAQEPPLTQEEIDLIAADPTTLSPEMRRKRAYALRRKVLQNPDSPAARQLEALRVAAEKGELKSQLPDPKSQDSGLTLHARNPGTPDTKPTTDAKSKTPAPAPAKAP